VTPFRLAALGLFLGAVPLCAQTAPDSAPAPVIRGVVVEPHDIFEPDEAQASSLIRFANSIHATTRRSVVERELLFKAGDLFDSAKVAETARNLRAMGIFRRVIIDSIHTDSGTVLRVTTKDGWSTRPQFDFNSTAGQTAWAVGLEELNLFGRATYASITYSDTPDRTAITLQFRQPRLIANRIYAAAGYQHRSDGRSVSAGMGLPFLSLASRASLTTSVLDFDGDVLRFLEGNPVPNEVLRRRYTVGRVDGALALSGSSAGFVRLGLFGQLRRDDFLDTSLVTSTPFPHTITAAIGPYFWASRASFLVLRNFRSFAREEDVDLSSTFLVGTYAAPKAFGYDHDGVGLQGNAGAGVRLPGGFATLRAAATGLVSGSGLDSGTVRVTGTWVVQPSRAHSLVVLGQLGWQDKPTPGEEFDLGLSRGPRAFYAHAFTGDRMVNFLVEYRWTMAESWWDVLGLGLAGFVDYGGAWYSGSPRRTGTDAGFGLRLGPSRSTDTDAVVSIDFARRFETDIQQAGWAVVVRRGVRF
jgi:hypothetical protein